MGNRGKQSQGSGPDSRAQSAKSQAKTTPKRDTKTKPKSGEKPRRVKRERATRKKAKDHLLEYLSAKFTTKGQTRMYKRFLVEAQAEWVKDKPGTEGTVEEHHAYSFDKLIEAISIYSPLYQREMLKRYLTEIMPQKDEKYDQAEDEAIFDVLFGDVDRGTIVRDIIRVLHCLSTESLRSLLPEVKARKGQRDDETASETLNPTDDQVIETSIEDSEKKLALEQRAKELTKKATRHAAHPDQPHERIMQRICEFFQRLSVRERLALWMLWELQSASGYTGLDVSNQIMADLSSTFDVGDDAELNWLKGTCEALELLNAHG